jgi:copper chaperone NosL
MYPNGEENKMKKISLLMVLATIFIISACGQKVEPRAINEKTDTCAVCNMAVMDNQFATQIVLDSGKSMMFDDIGCMYTWMKENKDQKIKAQFVRDYRTKEWVPSEEANYVYDKSIKTPMAYNVVSFESEKEADKFAEKYDTSTLTYDKLKSHKWEMNKEQMSDMDGEMKHSHDESGEMTEMDGHSH